jgi:hypothetical protein
MCGFSEGETVYHLALSLPPTPSFLVEYQRCLRKVGERTVSTNQFVYAYCCLFLTHRFSERAATGTCTIWRSPTSSSSTRPRTARARAF